MRCVILGASLVALAAGVSSGAWAQATDPGPTPPARTDPAPAPEASKPPGLILPAGSPVILELVQPVSSRAVKQGDMFAVRLAAPLVLDGRVVVPAGASGEGQVVDAGRAGALGKPAKLVLAARYITVEGTRLQLRGFRVGAAGRDNSNTIMVASFVPYVGMLALFARGGEIDVPAGTLGQARLVADLPVKPAEPVPAAAPPPPSSPSSTSSQ